MFQSSRTLSAGQIDIQVEHRNLAGPIESGLGWDLVWVESSAPGRVPAFEEVDASRLKTEWITDQRTETKRQAFEAMKAWYEIAVRVAGSWIAASGLLMLGWAMRTR